MMAANVHTPDTLWRIGARREEKVKGDEEGENLICVE